MQTTLLRSVVEYWPSAQGRTGGGVRGALFPMVSSEMRYVFGKV